MIVSQVSQWWEANAKTDVTMSRSYFRKYYKSIAGKD